MQVKNSCFYLQLQDKSQELLTFTLTQTNAKKFWGTVPNNKPNQQLFLTLTLCNGKMADIFH